MLAIVAFVSIAARAQDFYLAGKASLWRNDDLDFTSFQSAPEFGVNLDENWAIGGELVYNHAKGNEGKVNSFAIAPYARYTYYNNGNLSLFFEGGFGYSSSKIDGADKSTDGWQIGIKPGVALSLNDNFSILAKVGFIGYNDDYMYQKELNGFGVDLNGTNLSFGIVYKF